jgi:hypothetical protein
VRDEHAIVGAAGVRQSGIGVGHVETVDRRRRSSRSRSEASGACAGLGRLICEASTLRRQRLGARAALEGVLGGLALAMLAGQRQDVLGDQPETGLGRAKIVRQSRCATFLLVLEEEAYSHLDG